MRLHIFHKYGAWIQIAHGTIYRKRKDKSIPIGKTIEYERKCKLCQKKQTRFKDIMFG